MVREQQSHIYWDDSREQHSTGRRALRPQDQLRGSFLGQGQPTDVHDHSEAAPAARRTCARAPAKYEPRAQGQDQSRFRSSGSSQLGSEQRGPGFAQRGAGYGQSPPCDDDSIYDRGGGGYPRGGNRMADVEEDNVPEQRHGRGRKKIEPEDHQVTRHYEDGGYVLPGAGKRHLIPADHLKSDVLQPVEDIPSNTPLTNADMKEAVYDWLSTVHLVTAHDQAKWKAVIVEPRGTLWVVEALNTVAKSVCREGPTAKAIAEKLASLPATDLRYFGLRNSAGKGPEPAFRHKRCPFEDNPSVVSPGMHTILGQDAYPNRGLQGPTELSFARRDPMDHQRRYISSGTDHFESLKIDRADELGSHGHAKDMDCTGGIERGIGKGKRYIGTKDSLNGGGWNVVDGESEQQTYRPMRRH